MAAVDVDREITRCQTRKRANDAALEFVVRRSLADRFTYGQREEFANAERCRKRERGRAGGGDGVEIERHANANHGNIFGASSRSRLP